jgi:hypothetical protein
MNGSVKSIQSVKQSTREGMRRGVEWDSRKPLRLVVVVN